MQHCLKKLTMKEMYLAEIYGLKPSDLRRMVDHKVWRMKRKMEAQGEEF